MVNLVTPVAQTIETAKSEIEHKRNENGNESMHTSAVGGQQQRKKYNQRTSGPVNAHMIPGTWSWYLF